MGIHAAASMTRLLLEHAKHLDLVAGFPQMPHGACLGFGCPFGDLERVGVVNACSALHPASRRFVMVSALTPVHAAHSIRVFCSPLNSIHLFERRFLELMSRVTHRQFSGE